MLAEHSCYSEVCNLPGDALTLFLADNVVRLEISVDNRRMLRMKVLERISHVADESPDVILLVTMILYTLRERSKVAVLHHYAERPSRVSEGSQVLHDMLVMKFPEDFNLVLRLRHRISDHFYRDDWMLLGVGCSSWIIHLVHYSESACSKFFTYFCSIA